MTIANNLITISTALNNIKGAIEAKGVTPSGDITTYATAIGNISGGGSSSKYQLLQRVTDDSNNEIGTVSGFFTDGNDVEYAVVCLDAQYRLDQGKYCGTSGPITNLPQYQNQSIYSATETATFNTQKILDFCTAQSTTSTACSHCRSKSFNIDGTTYYGQLPNIVELIDIFRRRVGINSADTSANSYPELIVPTDMNVWSSSQFSDGNAWCVYYYGGVNSLLKNETIEVFPILEIPNANS